MKNVILYFVLTMTPLMCLSMDLPPNILPQNFSEQKKEQEMIIEYEFNLDPIDYYKLVATQIGASFLKIGGALTLLDILFHCALSGKNISIKQRLNNTITAILLRTMWKRNCGELRTKIHNLLRSRIVMK